MPVFNNALAGAAGSGGSADFKIERSLRFNSADSAYLNKSPSSAGNRRTFTWSGWVKRSKLGVQTDFFSAGNSSDYLRVGGFNSSDQLEMRSDSAVVHVVTSQVFRDVSAWYHIVIAVDTTQSTTSNRVKIYVNGSQVTDFSTSTYPGPNRLEAVNDTGEHRVGAFVDKTSATVYYPFDGYLADVHFVDGQQLAASDFGAPDATTGVWSPIEYTHSITATEAISYGVDNTSNAFDGTPGNYDTTGLSYGTWPGTIQNSQVGGYGANSVQVLKTNSGNAVTWTINTGNTNRYIHTSSDGINWTTNLTTISGTAVQVTSAWLGWGGGSNADYTTVSVPTDNSFHLDFSDNSSNAALGYDAAGSNNWTVNNIESGAPGNVDASGFVVTSGPASGNNDAGAIFDGNTTTKSYSHGYGTHYVHVDTSSAPISCSSTDTLTIYWSTSTTNPRDADLQLEFSGGGVTTYSAFTRTSGVQNNTITIGTTGSIVDIRFGETSASNPGELHLHAIKLNGTFLVTTQEPDSLLDSPTNYEASSGNNGGNYATYNPLNLHNTSDSLSEGNLKLTSSGSGTAHMGRGTIAMQSGKWYFEVDWVDTDHNYVGIVGQNDTGYNNSYLYLSNAKKSNSNGNSEGSSYGATWGDGDTIGVAFDADNGTLAFYKNGSPQGTAFTGIATDGSAGTYTPYPRGYVAITGNWNNHAATSNINFGQRPFAISSVPTGFKSLCTQNLPEPDIAKGSDYFDAIKYDGTGNTLNVTGLDFEPDLVYTATHNATGYIKYIWDDVRGATKALATSHTQGDDAEITVSNGLTSFNSDGFTVGNNAQLNESSSRKMIAWCWDGGSAFSNSAGSNGATIASSGLVNTTSGISILTYTGTANTTDKIAHGLNAVPELILLKQRNGVSVWPVYHGSLGTNTGGLILNGITAASSGTAGVFPTAPTSSVYTIGNDQNQNGSGKTYVAYCFAPIEGYSSFGKYTGNGSNNGPFIYTGFRPRWILTKAYSSNSNNNNNWIIIDTARDPVNEADKVLCPNNNASTLENSHTGIDILSNGFKLKDDSNGQSNYNGWDYIYAAFAENPFKYARAR